MRDGWSYLSHFEIISQKGVINSCNHNQNIYNELQDKHSLWVCAYFGC